MKEVLANANIIIILQNVKVSNNIWILSLHNLYVNLYINKNFKKMSLIGTLKNKLLKCTQGIEVWNGSYKFENHLSKQIDKNEPNFPVKFEKNMRESDLMSCSGFQKMMIHINIDFKTWVHVLENRNKYIFSFHIHHFLFFFFSMNSTNLFFFSLKKIIMTKTIWEAIIFNLFVTLCNNS